ncbi:MAG: PQQ-binding-like beta-propeller repeat protein [Jatrophihabitans sp.]|uniref:outer membrane protein assembly factor BamB family protein n=1 Tax=Jatrophihabitans sp. TaxID=1932789 RepID=UPI003914F40C
MPQAAGPLRVVRRLDLDGAVYASPLVVGGVVVAATEHDTVYAFDGSGRLRWKRNLGRPSPAGERPCGNIDPLGITGTPIYDAGSRLVYVSPELGAPPRHELVAIRIADGTVAWRRVIDLPGTETRAMQERGALAIAGGRVWVPFGGLNGDCGGYKGRVVGVRLDGSGAVVAYTVPTAREAGIWAPPGPVVDDTGHLLVAVGNGAAGPGDAYDSSDSVLKIDPAGRVVDSFSPESWATDNDSDLDLGSQGPALVGRWIFTAGKSGTAYVLRRDRLGGIGGAVSQAPVCRSFGGTAVDGAVVYVPCTDGLRAVRLDGAGRLQVLWHADAALTGSPVVGGGRVWTLDTDAGVLHALDPRTGSSLRSVPVGRVTRFATPALYGPVVLVPTFAGVTVICSD